MTKGALNRSSFSIVSRTTTTGRLRKGAEDEGLQTV
jgi:hypothetical protein